MARRIIALDISSQMLRAAVIESSLRQQRVIDLCQRPREPPLAEQLRVSHKLRFVGGHCAIVFTRGRGLSACLHCRSPVLVNLNKPFLLN
jgi:hypothetical protein